MVLFGDSRPVPMARRCALRTSHTRDVLCSTIRIETYAYIKFSDNFYPREAEQDREFKRLTDTLDAYTTSKSYKIDAFLTEKGIEVAMALMRQVAPRRMGVRNQCPAALFRRRHINAPLNDRTIDQMGAECEPRCRMCTLLERASEVNEVENRL